MLNSDLKKIKNNKEKTILNYIKRNPTGVNIKDIHENTGFARNTVSKYLSILETREKVSVKQLGRNKIYFSNDRDFIPKHIVQSFMKGVLSNLKNKFPAMAPILKDMGRDLAKYLYYSLPKSLLDDLRDLKNSKDSSTLILESFEDLYPQFDLFQDSYDISIVELNVKQGVGIYRFRNSQFIGATDDFIFYYHATCGVLEGFAKDVVGTEIECDVKEINIDEKEEEASFVDISVKIKKT